MEIKKDPLFEAWRRANKLGGAVKELFVHAPKKGETVAAPIDTLNAARWLQEKGLLGIEAISEAEGKIYYYILPEASGEVFTECYGYWEAEAEKLNDLYKAMRPIRLASAVEGLSLDEPPAVDAPAWEWEAYVSTMKAKAAAASAKASVDKIAQTAAAPVSSAATPEAPNKSSNIWLALALIIIPAALLFWLINF